MPSVLGGSYSRGVCSLGFGKGKSCDNASLGCIAVACFGQMGNFKVLTFAMILFVRRRYGLTSMARAQAAALRLGVQRYRDADNAVKVFEMTLRNEVR